MKPPSVKLINIAHPKVVMDTNLPHYTPFNRL